MAIPKGVEPISKLVAEYVSGYRCAVCDGIRDSHGNCPHERAEMFAHRQFQVEGWQRSIGADPRNKRQRTLFGSASSALRRSALAAGYRDGGLSESGVRTPDSRAIMQNHRSRMSGSVIEWRPHVRPSGDDLPL